MTKVISTEIETYNETTDKVERMRPTEPYIYEPVAGEKVVVVKWVRYPSYDFIFGIPEPTSPRYKQEFGYFQFRNTKTKKVVMGFYADQCELEELLEGFGDIIEASRFDRFERWEAYDKSKANKGRSEQKTIG